MRVVEREQIGRPLFVAQEGLEPVAGEDFEVRQRVRGQPRQCAALPVRQGSNRQCQRFEEDHRIGICFIDAIPKRMAVPCGAPARIEPGRGKGGFSCSRRCRDPDNTLGRRLLDLTEQPLSRDQAADLRCYQFAGAHELIEVSFPQKGEISV